MKTRVRLKPHVSFILIFDFQEVGPHKIVMGTDWPGSDFELERLKIRKAIPEEADRRLVEGENFQKLLRWE